MNYSTDLQSKVHNLAKYIIVGDKYKIVGSFGRKSYYITDIDISNDVSKYDINNIISKLKTLVEISFVDKKDIIFTYVTIGVDFDYVPKYKIMSDTEIESYNYEATMDYILDLQMKNKISEKESLYMQDLLKETLSVEKKTKETIQKLLIIEEILYKKSKVRWIKSDIMAGFKIVDKEKRFLANEIQKESNQCVLHYVLNYKNEYIQIDVGLMGIKKTNLENNQIKEKEKKFNKQKYLAYIKKEYYYILMDMVKFFSNNQTIYTNILYLLEKKYGIYKQIMANIFSLVQLYKYSIIDNTMLNIFYLKIMDKLRKTEIKLENEDIFKKNEDDKKEKTETIKYLEELELFVLNFLNNKFKMYALHYYSLLPNKNILPYAQLAF